MPPSQQSTEEKKRKPRDHKPYTRTVGRPIQQKDNASGSSSVTGTHNHKTSAKPAKSLRRQNLTLADWLLVLNFADSHPDMSQEDIVKEFATRHEGAIIFTQSTLSRKLKQRPELKARATANPSALDSRRPRIVTNPAIERALLIWWKSMESRGELVTGAMLMEKRKRFEERLEVPEHERLKGTGWVQSFCKIYKLREIRRHGEAGSVDPEAVALERERLAKILAEYAPRDIFNFDETGLFAFAPPDRGLASKQMSGKKKDKFRITLGFGVNADGSEKLEALFIGRSKMPRCFKKKSPEARGFYYRFNKKAWMTSDLFEEWVKSLDLKMRGLHRNIILLIDNFAGHVIAYQPKNIRIVFFAPNMTSFIQPLDAGIIRCFKAYYRIAFCVRALDLDDAGQADIYKIDLLEAMLMAKAAWKKITASTIINCWNHTKIMKSGSADTQATPTTNNASSCPATSSTPCSTPTSQPVGPNANDEAWTVLKDFANGFLTLPVVEERLAGVLGHRYRFSDWKPVIDAILQTEDDAAAGLEAIKKFQGIASNREDSSGARAVAGSSGLGSISLDTAGTTRIIVHAATGRDTELQAAEKQLIGKVDQLVGRKRVIGTAPTLDDLLNPVQELEIGESQFFDNDDDVLAAAVQGPTENEEDNSADEEDDDDDGDEDKLLPISEAITLCSQLEKLSISHAEDENALQLAEMLRKFRGKLVREDMQSKKQVDLHSFWGPASRLSGIVN